MLNYNEVNCQAALEGGDAEYGVPVESSPARSRPAKWVGRALVPVVTDEMLHIRLSVQDLRPGCWVSTREGNADRLWFIEAVTIGAGDGFLELTLKPKRL